MNAATTSQSNVFTALERHHIDALAADLGCRLDADIHAEYGETDDGQEWAALSAGLEPLVTFAAGAGTSGGHLILDASGRCVGSPRGTMNAERLVRSARKTAEAAYRRVEHEFA